MKLGYPNNPRIDILSEIEWIGKNGFDFIDIFLEDDMAVPEKIDVAKTNAILDKYKLDRVGHLGYYMPIGTASDTLRDFCVKESSRFFQTFSGLKVKYVTIHANWPGSLFKKEEGIAFQVKTLKLLIPEAKKYGICLMYEPLTSTKDDMDAVSEILKQLPEIYLHLDIGHANIFPRDPALFIEKFKNRLMHIHMHDNNGKEDLHLPIGTGKIDWAELIKVLKKHYDGTITLEIFSKDRDYVLMSLEKVRKMLV